MEGAHESLAGAGGVLYLKPAALDGVLGKQADKERTAEKPRQNQRMPDEMERFDEPHCCLSFLYLIFGPGIRDRYPNYVKNLYLRLWLFVKIFVWPVPHPQKSRREDRKPDSVSAAGAAADVHSSGSVLAGGFKLPTRKP